jgi:hypothetical protein
MLMFKEGYHEEEEAKLDMASIGSELERAEASVSSVFNQVQAGGGSGGSGGRAGGRSVGRSVGRSIGWWASESILHAARAAYTQIASASVHRVQHRVHPRCVALPCSRCTH